MFQLANWRGLFMIKLQIKPLSVNQCWRGRRFKTEKYKNYEKELFYLLPTIEISKKNKISIEIIFGVSSKNNDIDNPIKPFVDILSKKYQFNDKMIYHLEAQKEDVKKGQEFIKFKIANLVICQ